MSDFTDRLRLWARDIQLHRSALGADADILKAADTIERQDAEIAALQARVAELRDMLREATYTARQHGADNYTGSADVLERAIQMLKDTTP